jgi:glycosyltransferase involved in cell wall biosynthesis
MKILFSSTYYAPYVSGLTIFVKRLAEELSKAGNEVQVLCFRHGPDLQTEEILNKVKISRVNPWFKISKGFVSGDWINKSVLAVRSTDVVVVVLPQAEGWITAMIAKILRRKIVAIYICQVNLPNKMLNKVLEAANIITLDLADEVVTLTENYAISSDILKRYENKLRYIYPLVLKPEVDNEWKSKAKEKIGANKFVIGVAGRLAAEKGLEYLFEAIPELKLRLNKDFCIAIAGQTDPVGEEAYKEKIKRLGESYKDTVIFLGEVPDKKMGSFYSLLDVLVLPSVNSTEAFGMVQVEAMLWGVPIVASDLPGVRVPVQKTGMGIVTPIKNPQKIAEAIALVYTNRTKYHGMKETVEKEFNYGNIYNKWKNLLLG